MTDHSLGARHSRAPSYSGQTHDRAAPPPLVSVIIPVYNRQAFLAEAIGSVLTQTYDHIELIVVDDGSTQPAESLVRQLAPSARYVWQPHAGVAAARNRGLDDAQGELIAFQDSDDVWHPEKLALQVALLRESPQVGVVCTAERVIDSAGQVIGSHWKPLYGGVVTEALFEDVFVVMPSTVVRRSVVQQVGRFDTNLRINSDYQYWLRASLVTEFGYVDRPLVDERRTTNRLTGAKAEGAVLQYGMLLDFYYHLGGCQVIRPRVAERVLAKSAFRAGRQLRREGFMAEGREMFGKSLRHRRTPRALWGWWLASARIWPQRLAIRRASPPSSSMTALVGNISPVAPLGTPHSREY